MFSYLSALVADTRRGFAGARTCVAVKSQMTIADHASPTDCRDGESSDFAILLCGRREVSAAFVEAAVDVSRWSAMARQG